MVNTKGGTWQRSNPNFGGGVHRGNSWKGISGKGKQWLTHKCREGRGPAGGGRVKPQRDPEMWQDLMAAKETESRGRPGISTGELVNVINKHLGEDGTLGRDQQKTLRDIAKRAGVARPRGRNPRNATWSSVRARKLALDLGWGKTIDPTYAARLGLQLG